MAGEIAQNDVVTSGWVLLVDDPAATVGQDTRGGYIGMFLKKATAWSDPVGRKVKFQGHSPECRNLALHFVPNIRDRRFQRNSHYPSGAVLKFNKKTDIVAPMRRVSE